MKKRFRCLIAGILVGVTLICPALAASPFPDVDENAEYAEAVEYLKNVGVMQGDEKGNFNPNNTVTRAQMAVIICQMLGETDGLTVSNTFSDVPTSHWANKYVARASELSIVSGYGDGKFGPDDQVTYEQAVTMVVRAIGDSDAAQRFGGYPDGFIKAASENGYLEGFFAEKGDQMMRWQIATICYNIMMGGAEE